MLHLKQIQMNFYKYKNIKKYFTILIFAIQFTGI